MLDRSESLLGRARKVIPGGVNSPVRAFKSVGGTPPFIERAKGAMIYDADGNEYIDFVLTWGPAILGHAHPEVIEACKEAMDRGTSFGAPTELEITLAEMVVERVPGVDLVRLVNSGTEACMSAVRVARGATGRDKIIKFRGCYHGHADLFLISAGSGALTLGTPNSPGVTAGTAQDTLLANYNDIASVQELFAANPDQIACVIVEPICGNTGCIPPRDNFLGELKRVCHENGALLILDEVMTGFRVARGGAAQVYDVEADLYCFGKVVGGGFPLAAYAGSEAIMRNVAPDGKVYQAGTLSGNPIAVTAGITTLELLDQGKYDQLEETGAKLEEFINGLIQRHGYPISQTRVGAMFGLFFTDKDIRQHADVSQCDLERFNTFFHAALDRGVYLAPSQYEAGFLCVPHADVLDRALSVIEDSLKIAFNN